MAVHEAHIYCPTIVSLEDDSESERSSAKEVICEDQISFVVRDYLSNTHQVYNTD